jgi:cytochrome P450
MDSPDSSSSSRPYLDEHITVEMSREDVITLIAAMHVYVKQGVSGRRAVVRSWSDDVPSLTQSADDPQVSDQEILSRLGTLIWRLEDAAASPRRVGRHSADAVDPGLP